MVATTRTATISSNLWNNPILNSVQFPIGIILSLFVHLRTTDNNDYCRRTSGPGGFQRARRDTTSLTGFVKNFSAKSHEPWRIDGPSLKKQTSIVFRTLLKSILFVEKLKNEWLLWYFGKKKNYLFNTILLVPQIGGQSFISIVCPFFDQRPINYYHLKKKLLYT